MDYHNFTPPEAQRELERFETELGRLRHSETQPAEQRAIEKQIEILRARVNAKPK